MKYLRRLVSGFLSLAVTGSLCMTGLPAAFAAGKEPEMVRIQSAGSIALTIRFDLPQTWDAVKARDITFSLTGSDKTTTVSLSKEAVTDNGLDASVSVMAKNTEGVELTTEQRIGYYTAELSGLPAGEYQLDLTGTGYASFSQKVTLDAYSQHIIVGTGDGTFSLGDFNQDGKVDTGDLEEMDAHLGTQEPAYDLDGDGHVDVTDLAYVNYMIGVTGDASIKETAALCAAQVDTSGFMTDGDLSALLTEEGTVALYPAEGSNELKLPITLDGSGMEMSQIVITSPEGVGAVQTGTVEVETADGATESYTFDYSAPEGVHAIGRSAGQSVITIDLKQKVAVKKVTITVTAVQGQDGGVEYAAITQVAFLKDIVPDDPQNDADKVKGVATLAGDGKVELSWNPVNNVTGYIVRYGLSETALTSSVAANTNRVTVSGLTNLKTYYFQVVATASSGSGTWEGTPSDVVQAMPEPSKAPGAPSNISVTEADQSLRLSWGSTKDAVYYQVFYREQGVESFTQFGGDIASTSAVITGLTNDTVYEVAVKAGNGAGVGPYSAIALGTPQSEEIEMPELPTDGRIPNSEIISIEMPAPSNVDASLCPSFTTDHLIDNDAATYWIAQSWSRSSAITYTFADSHDMNYLVVVPYLGDGHKNAIRTYAVIIKDEDGKELLNSGNLSAPSMTDKNYLIFTFPAVQGAKSVTLSMGEWEGNGHRVSISEIAFYNSDSLPEDIADLFTDGSFTELKSSVAETQINELTARLEEKSDFYLELSRLQDELALAQGLCRGEAVLGLVKNDFQSRSTGQDAAYGQSASDLQPLGISARAGAEVAIYAQLPDGKPVYVTPTQFFGESGIWRGSAIQLTNGRNYITVPKIGDLADERGGMLYLTYAGENPQDIKLQVRGDGNTFVIPVLELSGWYDMNEDTRKSAIKDYITDLQNHVSQLSSAALTTDIRNATEISTPSILLSIPADRALAGLKGTNNDVDRMTEIMYQNVLAWEEELFVVNKVQGIIESNASLDDYEYPMTTRQNIRYMRMFAGAFMYAAGNHVGVGYGSTSALVQGTPVSVTGVGSTNGLFGWGIAHEIGHNMDKLGKAEITNNIYSLAVQAWDGSAMIQNTRLTASNIWGSIYDKVSVGWPGAANNVFVQLGMYWQLHLAYDTAENPLGFYNRFFTLWKSGEYSGYSYDERVALAASEVAEHDLTEFFTRWGMTLSEEVKDILDDYPSEARAIWYLNDASYRLRLENVERADSGAVTVNAEVNGNVVTLNIEGGSDSALGYVIYRNDRSIGFTTTNTYTDDLGAANNLTYAYSVVPVDKLGYMGTKSDEVQISIHYDVVIDSSLYSSVIDGDTLTITPKSGTLAVTGIKVSGEGNYTVQLKEGSSTAWTEVGLTGFSDTGAAYFNRPNSIDSESYWTYDVAELRITGIQPGATVELLAYPGDRIDFYDYEGATVGILAKEYKYGSGSEDVIPAGTLVIAGLYRGDPVYNTVELQARYTKENEGEDSGEVTERPMAGYALLFAAEGGDTADGFFLYVPDLEQEEALNTAGGITNSFPLEIRAILYRTNEPIEGSYDGSSTTRRITSQTLWISFPEVSVDEENETITNLPLIELTNSGE